MIPSLRKYYKEAKPGRSHPGKTGAGLVLNKFLDDKLLVPKLSFFNTVASIFEPFLTKYQANRPLLPFLHDELERLVRGFLKRFVKRNVLDEANTSFKLVQIDLTKPENLKTAANVDIGIAASDSLNKADAPEKDKLLFKNECRTFMIDTAKKILEKCPLKYKLVKAVGCLMPSCILNEPDKCLRMMKTCLSILLERNRIDAAMAERASVQFSNFLDHKDDIKKVFSNFDRNKDRLDHAFYAAMGQNNDFKDSWHCIKMLLILSHGNAFVESGFSVNKDIMVENMLEETLIGLRHIWDYIARHGGDVKSIEITPDMVRYARSAHSRYKAAVEQKARQEDDEKKVSQVQRDERKRKAEELKTLQDEKREAQAKIDQINKEIIKRSKKQ